MAVSSAPSRGRSTISWRAAPKKEVEPKLCTDWIPRSPEVLLERWDSAGVAGSGGTGAEGRRVLRGTSEAMPRATPEERDFEVADTFVALAALAFPAALACFAAACLFAKVVQHARGV